MQNNNAKEEEEKKILDRLSGDLHRAITPMAYLIELTKVNNS